MEKRWFFKTLAGTIRCPYAKKKKIPNIDLTPYIRSNQNELIIHHRSKCRAQNNKTLKEKIGEDLIYFGFDDKFLDTISNAIHKRKKMDKTDFINIFFCRRQSEEDEKTGHRLRVNIG